MSEPLQIDLTVNGAHLYTLLAIQPAGIREWTCELWRPEDLPVAAAEQAAIGRYESVVPVFSLQATLGVGLRALFTKVSQRMAGGLAGAPEPELPLAERLRVEQTPETGLGAIMGKWPGDETDEQIREGLEGL